MIKIRKSGQVLLHEGFEQMCYARYSNSKIHDLGWKPKFNLDDSLGEMIKRLDS